MVHKRTMTSFPPSSIMPSYLSISPPSSSLTPPPVTISWNFADFRVRYPSLAAELCVAGVYLRFLLSQDGPAQSQQDTWQVQQPGDLFSALYHRFLREADAGLVVEGALTQAGTGGHGGAVK